MQRLCSIQMLRGVAACAVVVCHALDWDLGAAGVDVFFVISGFIIGQVMGRRAPAAFLADRLWRIFPIYWICALPWFFVAVYTGQLETGRTLTSLTLWPIYGEFAQPYLRPAWSLCFELLFYVSVTVALATGKGRWLIAAFAVAFTVNIIAPSPLAGFLGYPLIFNFLIGLMIGKVPSSERAALPIIGVALLVMALSPAALFHHNADGVSNWIALYRLLWWTLPSAMLVYGALSLERLATWRVPILIGNASYSIYLTHLLALAFLDGWIAVLAAVALGLLVHVAAERPILSWRKRSFVATAQPV